MLHALLRPGILLGLLAAALVCAAQETWEPHSNTPRKPTGSLSGTVYCADTNQPARLAQVHLLHFSANEFGSSYGGQTDLEGRFSLSHIEEGDYYVVAVLPGYVNLLGILAKPHLDAMSDEDRKILLARIPSVAVAADQTAQVNVRIDRGAELDGTVTWDDGSPAIGLHVMYRLNSTAPAEQHRPALFIEDQIGFQEGQPTTDDRGHFRILGVPPGEYLVHVMVPISSNERQGLSPEIGAPYLPNQLDVYAGGALRTSKAQAVEVDAAGAAKDADIVIPLSRLHTIRGQVLLKSSNQPPVNANVQLLYADTKEELRSIYAPDGQFEFDYVPEDSFILRAAAGSEAAPDMEKLQAEPGPRHVSWTYPEAGDGSPELPLLVTGNVENLSIGVPDPDPKKKGPTMGIDFGGGFVSAGPSTDSSGDSSSDSSSVPPDNPQ
jgi:hypothetical protein